jgi:hypothetical protein
MVRIMATSADTQAWSIDMLVMKAGLLHYILHLYDVTFADTNSYTESIVVRPPGIFLNRAVWGRWLTKDSLP